MEKVEIKVDENNDIYEINVTKYTQVGINTYINFETEVYTIDNAYESEYSKLWDEHKLNTT